MIERPLAELLSALECRRITAQEMCETALTRIQADANHIRALSDVLAEQARATAQRIDARRAAGLPVGALAGVPVIVKDLIDVSGARCCAGLEIFSDYRPTMDAGVVQRLREADAVIIGMGKTDSGAFGVVTPEVTNPRDPTKIAGGSSGGSAAAVAAGWCSFAIGTDTGGSVRIPAACCGVSGFKPTKGLIPTQGVRPLAPSFDHVGPIFRHVADAKIIMEALTGESFSQPDLKEGIRLGYSLKFLRNADSEIIENFEKILSILKENQFDCIEVDLPDANESLTAHLSVSLTEAAKFYIYKLKEFKEAIPYPLMSGIDYAKNIHGYEYLSALNDLNKIKSNIEYSMKNVNCLILPTLSYDIPNVPIQEESLAMLVKNTAIFNHPGFPALSLAAPQFSKKIPPSIQIVGQRNDDAKLVAIANMIDTTLSLTFR